MGDRGGPDRNIALAQAQLLLSQAVIIFQQVVNSLFCVVILESRFYGGCSKYVAVCACSQPEYLSSVNVRREVMEINHSPGNRCCQLCHSDRCPSLRSEDLYLSSCLVLGHEDMCSVYPVLAGYVNRPVIIQLLKC